MAVARDGVSNSSDAALLDHSSSGQTHNSGKWYMYVIPIIALCIVAGIVIALNTFRRQRHHRSIPTANTAIHIRQSRVSEITRELLDTIPIVKFKSPSSCEKREQSDIEAGDYRDFGRQETGTEGQRRRTNNNSFQTAEVARGTTILPRSREDVDYFRPSCPICAEAFADGEDLRVVPCSHRFHARCVDPWFLARSSTCPMCRSDVVLSRSVARDNPVTKNEHNRAEQV
ncbi:hypothetical protein BJY01DRAFT_246514 [Aspergillus pseudoustus]|uniref:RING-type E3 ubiquitin transferase n=1 Tax=Aspergillus pseudoustus TaxID=1810923 RepID=A0ABR4K7A7_9EURO